MGVGIQFPLTRREGVDQPFGIGEVATGYPSTLGYVYTAQGQVDFTVTFIHGGSDVSI